MRISLITLLAMAGAAQAASAQSPARPDGSTTVTPLVVKPPVQTQPPPGDAAVVMPGDQDDDVHVLSVWPSKAYQTRLDGRVRLRCEIDPHGLAEWCDVASESPAGQGFGAAALALRSTFKLAPAMGPDGAQASMKTIDITFQAPHSHIETGRQATGEGALDASTFRYGDMATRLGKITLLNYPVWVRAPSFDDLVRAYPEKRAHGAEGYVVAHCRVLHTGALSDCKVIKEIPEQRGFANAALGLTEKFRVAPSLATAREPEPIWTDVAMRIPPPAAIAGRAVTTPVWITGVDPTAAPKVFPPEAVKAGVVTGRGTARCIVAADGSLTQCAPEAADPGGLGFSEAAVKLATSMRMNLWSADDAPVVGGVVRIPFRLNLKAGA
jgi:TonB family protein